MRSGKGGGRRRVGAFTMPPHVLPDLKRNEPVVTPAVLRLACALLGSGHFTPPQPVASLPRPSPLSLKLSAESGLLISEIDFYEFEVSVKSLLWLLKEKVDTGVTDCIIRFIIRP